MSGYTHCWHIVYAPDLIYYFFEVNVAASADVVLLFLLGGNAD